MEDTRVLTSKALDEFIATQSTLLAQKLGNIDRLRELNSELVNDHLPFSNVEDLDEWFKRRLEVPLFPAGRTREGM